MRHAKKNRPALAGFAPKIILSASRRTDIPAFYSQWLVNCLDRGRIARINPFNRQVRHYEATPDHVHSLVLWSKNFGPMISSGQDQYLRSRGYNLFFNFTINSPNPDLEPHLPPLEERLAQLAHLASTFGPQSINWRFDPICVYRIGNGPQRNNLEGFAHIAERAARLGISTCITSFVDLYAKVKRRSQHAGLAFLALSLDARLRILTDLSTCARRYQIGLRTCCEATVLASLAPQSGIAAASCISADQLTALYGPGITHRPDTGQRRKSGCGCSQSIDIGDYRQHPCAHNCLFCYANPVPPANHKAQTSHA